MRGAEEELDICRWAFWDGYETAPDGNDVIGRARSMSGMRAMRRRIQNKRMMPGMRRSPMPTTMPTMACKEESL
jgi:hypothetical protein